MADGISLAYSGAGADLKNKLKRVVQVWRDRSVFPLEVQEDVEKRISDHDKGRGTKGRLGGSLFGSAEDGNNAIPSELKDIVKTQRDLTKATIEGESRAKEAADSYNSTYLSLASDKASAPVEAARINRLLETLGHAHSSLQIALATRESLIASLEKTINEHRAARENEEMQLRDLDQKRTQLEERKTHVDRAIMSGVETSAIVLPSDVVQSQTAVGDEGPDVPRPETEPLTPPPVESLTPPGAPPLDQLPSAALDGPANEESHTPTGTPPRDSLTPQPRYAPDDPRRKTAAPLMGSDIDSDLAPSVNSLPGLSTQASTKRSNDDVITAANGGSGGDPRRKSSGITFKRRKTSDEMMDEEALEGLDADVVGGLG